MTQKTMKEKALEIVNQFANIKSLKDYEGMDYELAKECALITIDRNIEIFTELVNRMDDFSNESRQVIWQLIEDEVIIKIEIEKL